MICHHNHLYIRGLFYRDQSVLKPPFGAGRNCLVQTLNLTPPMKAISAKFYISAETGIFHVLIKTS